MNTPTNKLINNIKAAKLAGGEDRINAQYNKGKLTARQRIDVLLDNNSFQEIGMFVKPAVRALTDANKETNNLSGQFIPEKK